MKAGEQIDKAKTFHFGYKRGGVCERNNFARIPAAKSFRYRGPAAYRQGRVVAPTDAFRQVEEKYPEFTRITLFPCPVQPWPGTTWWEWVGRCEKVSRAGQICHPGDTLKKLPSCGSFLRVVKMTTLKRKSEWLRQYKLKKASFIHRCIKLIAPAGECPGFSFLRANFPKGGTNPMQALLQWPGGKARLANKIISLFPPPDSYSVFVDAFGGAANITLIVPDRPGLLKIYNDLDGELFNFFYVLRDPALRNRLVEMLTWTPYSRRQFKECLEMPVPDDPVERAWRFFTVTEQSFVGKSLGVTTPGNWAYSICTKVSKPGTWVHSVDSLSGFGQRLRDVQLENLDYRDLIARYDGPRTLYYIDPPYLVRHCSDNLYVHEMKSVEEHRQLAEVLNNLKGMAVLSGYDSPEYREWYDRQGWERHEFDVVCSMVRATLNHKGHPRPRRTECVWLNPAAVRARERAKPVQMSLFDLGVL